MTKVIYSNEVTEEEQKVINEQGYGYIPVSETFCVDTDTIGFDFREGNHATIG